MAIQRRNRSNTPDTRSLVHYAVPVLRQSNGLFICRQISSPLSHQALQSRPFFLSFKTRTQYNSPSDALTGDLWRIEMDLLISQLVAEAEQTAPQPTVILNEIWKTETRNERLGQALSIALVSREANDTKLENVLAALKENTCVLGNTGVRDSLREEITKRLAARMAIDAQINRYQTMLELSMSLLWERWGDEIEEFSVAEKGLRLLREALVSPLCQTTVVLYRRAEADKVI